MSRAKRTHAHFTAHLMIAVTAFFIASSAQAQDEQVFSGPQAGEPLPPLQVVQWKGEDDWEEVELFAGFRQNPTTLVFLSEVTRPSVAVIRALATVSENLDGHDLNFAVVFLTNDINETKEFVKRAQHALPTDSLIGISPDLIEGPGAYGLNRHVAMTVVVAKDEEVVDNFAIVQPSVEVDTIKIATAMHESVGVEPPTRESLAESVAEMRGGAARQDAGRQAMEASYRRLMQPLLQKDASESRIDELAAGIEAAAMRDENLRERIAGAAKRIVDSGNLANYGNEFAQGYLKKWADEWND